MICRIKSSVLLSALILLAIAPVTAQTVAPVQRYEGNTENQGTVFLLDYNDPNAGPTFYNTYFGAQITTLSNWGGTPDPVTFDAYCINLDLPIGEPSFEADLLSLDGFSVGRPGVSNKGGAIAWLYNNYVDVARTNNRESTALQLALWETIYDWDGSTFAGTSTAINLQGGFFQFAGTVAGNSDASVNSDIIARANTMLTSWGGKTDSATWIKPKDPTLQDLVGPGSVSNGQPIPEPGTFALLAGVALPFVWRKSRRRS